MTVSEGFDIIPVDGGYPVLYRPGIQHGCDRNDCTLPSRALELEQAIFDAKQVLLNLVSNYAALRVEVNGCHDHMQRLPAGVVSDIFRYCSPPTAITNDMLMHERLSDVFKPPRDFFPLMLGSICHFWREIAWSTPQLWTTVYVYPGTSDHDQEVQIHVLSEWMGRSGQLPIAITLYSPAPKRESNEWQYIDSRLLSLVRLHSHRWGSIRAFGSQNTIERLFLTPYEPPGQALDYLSIDVSDRGGSTGCKPSRLPKASQIFLREFNFTDVMSADWEKARFLWVGAWSLDTMRPIFPLTPNLRTLAIETNLEFKNHSTSTPTPTLEFPHLESVIITGQLKVLECIQTQWLVPTVEIRESSSSQCPWTVIPKSLQPQCSLAGITTLRISGCRVDSDMLKYLGFLNNLTSLGIFCQKPKRCDGGHKRKSKDETIEYAPVHAEIWYSLSSGTYSPNATGPFLPMLTELEYEGVQSFRWPIIPRLFLPSVRPASLKSLKMKVYRDRANRRDPFVTDGITEETVKKLRDLCVGCSIYISVARIDGDVVVDLIESPLI